MRYEELTIEGRNAVIEAFRSGKTIDRVFFILDNCQDGPIMTIKREAKKDGLPHKNMFPGNAWIRCRKPESIRE